MPMSKKRVLTAEERAAILREHMAAIGSKGGAKGGRKGLAAMTPEKRERVRAKALATRRANKTAK